MTLDQAKRAAFLIAALEDLTYELDVPAVERDAERGVAAHGNMPPLCMADDEAFDLSMVLDGGGIRTLATLDRDLVTKAAKFLVAIIKAELGTLGVDVD